VFSKFLVIRVGARGGTL